MGGANKPSTRLATPIDNINAPIRTVWVIQPANDLVFDLTGFPDTVDGPIEAPFVPMFVQSSIGQERMAPYHRAELVQLFPWNSTSTGPNPFPLPPPQAEGPLRVLRAPGAVLPPRTLATAISVSSGGYQVEMCLTFENGLAAGDPDDDVIEIVVDIELAAATAFGPVISFRRRFRFVGGAPTATVTSFDSFQVYTGDAEIIPMIKVVGVRRLAPVADLTTPADVAPPDYVFLPSSTRYFNGDGAAGGLDLTGTVTLSKTSHIVLTRKTALTLTP